MSEANDPWAAKKNRETKWIAPENPSHLYTNSIDVAMSYFDLRLMFGVVEESTEDSIVVREMARVMMSPQHAKTLANILNQKIAAYEKRFGPLPKIPSSVTDKSDEATSATEPAQHS